MAGWVGFAGMVMVIVGGIDICQGLIALLTDNYYVVSGVGIPGRRSDHLGMGAADLGRPARARRPWA